jgi:hypothetical protein
MLGDISPLPNTPSWRGKDKGKGNGKGKVASVL